MRYPEYLHSFTSCNRAFRIKKPTEQLWCGECPKCVFVFLLCSAFMNPEQIVSVFGQNLFEKEALLPLFKDVLGNGTMKPFDCVGTFEEAKVAFVMAEKHFGRKDISIPQTNNRGISGRQGCRFSHRYVRHHSSSVSF